MKIRTGFVSNSSSSSFCIYGTSVGCNRRIDSDALEDKISNMKLKVRVVYGQEEIYVGREWSSIHDDETGAMFKQSIKEEISKLLNEDIKCGTFEESWYDG